MEGSLMIKTLDDFSLVDILPESLKSDSDVYAIAEALTPIFKEVYAKISLVTLYDNIPDNLLDFVAYGENAPYYDTNLPPEQKRELIKKADYFHSHRGTPASVEELITAVFGEGKVEEWFEYGGAPGYFKVVTSNTSVTQELANQFTRALDSVKRKSAWLEKVEITQMADMNLYFGGIVHSGDSLTLRQVI